MLGKVYLGAEQTGILFRTIPFVGSVCVIETERKKRIQVLFDKCCLIVAFHLVS